MWKLLSGFLLTRNLVHPAETESTGNSAIEYADHAAPESEDHAVPAEWQQSP